MIENILCQRFTVEKLHLIRKAISACGSGQANILLHFMTIVQRVSAGEKDF
jgi:hypothetical protein